MRLKFAKGSRLSHLLHHQMAQARGSADELQDDLETLHRRGLLPPDRAHLIATAKLIAKKITRLIDALEGRTTADRR